MRRSNAACFFLAFLFFSLSALPVLAAEEQPPAADAGAEEMATAVDITQSCTCLYRGAPLTRNVMDNSGYTKLVLDGGEITISSEQEIGALYIEFSRPPALWTLQVDGVARSGGTQAYLHEYFGGLSATELTLRFDGETRICDLFVFSAGAKPEWVQDWAQPWEKADVLFLPTHSDDDQLFFAGLIPWCLSQGARVQVAYFVQHYDTGDRMNELLDGLWICGLRRYPVLGAFRDMENIPYLDTITAYNNSGVYWSDFEGYQVGLYRRFRPQIVVTHARDGEYGHGAHILNCNTALAAALLSADPTAYPESAETYGTWDVPKLYVHNYAENQVTLDFDTPQDCFGGKTPFAMCQDGFRCHQSQFAWAFDDWLYSTSMASTLRPSPCEYGLYRTLVGADTHTDTFFDNITLYDAEALRAAAMEAERLEREAAERLAAEEAAEQARLAAAAQEARLAQEAQLAAEARRHERRWIMAGLCAAILAACAAIAGAIVLHRRKDIEK